MRIATAPCNWNNGDIPDFRPYTPHGQMMDEMVEAGYSATEWGPGMPDDPAVVRVAERTGRTPAQVTLRWHVQRGDVVIAQASSSCSASSGAHRTLAVRGRKPVVIRLDATP